jgi:hypothetical protein
MWTDGLGNPEHNTLPTCQVRRLADLLQTLGDTELGKAAKPEMPQKLGKSRVTVEFWLDTLCIPVEPQFQVHRDLYIHQIHKIYLAAAGVLVLDPDLQQLGRSSKPIEIVAR